MRRQPHTAGELRQDFGAFFLWKCVEFLDQFSRTVSHATSDPRWGDLVKESGLEPCYEKARRYEHEEAEAHSRFHTHVANRAEGLQPPLTTIGVQSFNAMRTARLALGIVAVGFFAAWALVDRRVELPPVDPGVEQICGETMRRIPADLSWVAPDREMRVRGREIKTVTLDELPSHAGSVVRGLECCTPNSNGLRCTRPALRWRSSPHAHRG